VQRIERPGSINWSAIAQAEGLFDQSHLVREFHEFAGLTPTEYLARKGPYSNALPGF
jgi:AraC-like DNA-binding protein